MCFAIPFSLLDSIFRDPKKLPVVTAGPLNFCTNHWLTGLMWKAFRKGVDESDLYDTPYKDSAWLNAERYVVFDVQKL